MNYQPIAIPELGRDAITWAMCRNPMCRNFGVPCESVADDSRYRRDPDSPDELECRYCGHGFTPLSNEAIRPVARYFHSTSLPFAACPTADCKNHGVNVFENMFPGRRHGINAYTRNVRRNLEGDRIQCKECESTIRIGEPLRLHRGGDGPQLVEKILEGVLLGVNRRALVARRFMRISPEDKNLPLIKFPAYYNQLTLIAARLKDYQSWINARFFMPSSSVDFSQTARVSTSVIEIPLPRRFRSERSRATHLHTTLKFIVSVLVLQRGTYLLAAHPCFLPWEFGPDPKADDMDRETGRPSVDFAHQWDCLEHPVHHRFNFKTPEEMLKNLADVSQYDLGCYVRSPYAEAAHFLVVEKMLRRFRRVSFCFDAGRDRLDAAMVALAPGIAAGRTDVVVTKEEPCSKEHAEDDTDAPDSSDSGARDPALLLKKVWRVTEERVQRKFKSHTAADDAPSAKSSIHNRARQAAAAYREALSGDDIGHWAWLDFPPPMKHERSRRTLWATRMIGKTFDDDALIPLLHASLMRGHYAMDAMREHLTSLRSGKAELAAARYSPIQLLIDEARIYLLARNGYQMTSTQQAVPAAQVGLWANKTPLPYLTNTVLRFRLGIKQAETLTRWMTRLKGKLPPPVDKPKDGGNPSLEIMPAPRAPSRS